MDMCWNVFYEDVNAREIKIWNVFNHSRFAAEVKECARQKMDKSGFGAELKHIAMYYFWSKSEYEVVVTSWPPYITRFEANQIKQADLPTYRQTVNLECGNKFSVYEQLAMNWDAFVAYCWKELHS